MHIRDVLDDTALPWLRARHGEAPHHRRVPGLVPLLLVVPLLLAVAACAEPDTGRQAPRLTPSSVDSLLAELGGQQTAALSRGQRWRLISSVGTGLPPVGYGRKDLPSPESREAALLEAYCVQCHNLPSPQMHSAEEWPILVRRMVMRARTLENRMGGPLTEGMVGEMVLAGMARGLVPSQADVDSLTAYLQEHALPTVDPDRLSATEDGRLYVEMCSRCHQTPAPDAHTAREWREEVVPRMQGNMARMDHEPLAEEELARIVDFLERRAGG